MAEANENISQKKICFFFLYFSYWWVLTDKIIYRVLVKAKWLNYLNFIIICIKVFSSTWSLSKLNIPIFLAIILCVLKVEIDGSSHWRFEHKLIVELSCWLNSFFSTYLKFWFVCCFIESFIQVENSVGLLVLCEGRVGTTSTFMKLSLFNFGILL